MKRCLAAVLAATIVSGPLAAPSARADGPFEAVPLPRPAPHPHRAAYACMLLGTGMIVGSFALARHADDAYARYLDARLPDDIERSYDEAVRYDRWSSGLLISGEIVVAAGVYLRFLRRPESPAVSLLVAPGACAVSCRF